MKYLLDTNICIYIIKEKPRTVIEKFLAMKIGDLGISAITVAELEYGVSKSTQQQKNRDALDLFLLPFAIIPFDKESTKTYGSIRAELEKTGQLIGAMDLLIASQAVSNGVTLITNDVKEFSRIKQLLIENWAQ